MFARQMVGDDRRVMVALSWPINRRLRCGEAAARRRCAADVGGKAASNGGEIEHRCARWKQFPGETTPMNKLANSSVLNETMRPRDNCVCHWRRRDGPQRR